MLDWDAIVQQHETIYAFNRAVIKSSVQNIQTIK